MTIKLYVLRAFMENLASCSAGVRLALELLNNVLIAIDKLRRGDCYVGFLVLKLSNKDARVAEYQLSCPDKAVAMADRSRLIRSSFFNLWALKMRTDDNGCKGNTGFHQGKTSYRCIIEDSVVRDLHSGWQEGKGKRQHEDLCHRHQKANLHNLLQILQPWNMHRKLYMQPNLLKEGFDGWILLKEVGAGFDGGIEEFSYEGVHG
ncbi:hypothetical protein F3Y22_tig00110017pilonHSYRG00025 [Hibiscus syriacus]|uniref:Uncharacterized protein n=1 Tax=Hibiscus syriacus TaxID=106335 RepID=A0A6A3BPV2_HIBSY|nr:hypothetical protein F3Y22_tig00110017pilonHSYRG00025 [Hibiscus syriacus]